MLRKKKSDQKQQHYKTGGGEFKKTEFTPLEEKLLSIVSPSTEGLMTRNDDDMIEKFTTEPIQVLEDVLVLPLSTNDLILNSVTAPVTVNENICTESVSTPTVTTIKAPWHRRKTKQLRDNTLDNVSAMAKSKLELMNLQIEDVKLDMEEIRYGLLGSSGCGKTTLLSCIVGRKKLDSGEMFVLGGKPGSKSSGIPGPQIGFMPQEISLYGEFTIRETLIYFGWICGMTTEEVDEKLIFLSEFLQLPSQNTFVRNMSGGQQRRVSFAAALVHDPELLILDEPTVGVDPILRHSMWEHLVDITKNSNTTIIITTHYIDEMKQADCIGLMRGGYFLAETTPQNLMNHLGTDNLEDAYLQLSIGQNNGRDRGTFSINSNTCTQNQGSLENTIPPIEDNNAIRESTNTRGWMYVQSQRNQSNIPTLDVPSTKNTSNKKHLIALTWKNRLWMWRNKPVIAFVILLPLFQMSMFTFAIGGDPKEIKIAVANHELKEWNMECPLQWGCNVSYLSCRFLKHLQGKKLLLKNFKTDDEATNYVNKGHAYASMTFPANYSAAIRKRIDDGRNVANWNIDNSLVTIYQDKSNQQIAIYLWKNFNLIFLEYIQEYLADCRYSKKIIDIPIHFNKPIYGDSQPTFTDFAAPGAVLTMSFFLALAVSSSALIAERKEGVYERTTVIGVSEAEILLAHFLTDFVIILAQVIVMLSVTFGIIGMKNEGSMVIIFFLTLLTGMSGMAFGYFVGSFCNNDQTVTVIGLGMMNPMIALGGMLWPREGMYSALQVMSVALPLTFTTDAFRAVLHRGWGLQHATVCKGFYSTSAWTVAFMILNLALIKWKK